MKKFFLILFSILLLFSCATGKELERVETIVEKVEEKDVIEEVETESVPFTSIEEEEEEELDLSSLPVLFDDGEFIDIKDESAAIQKEEKATETPIVVEKETVEIEHKEEDEKDKLLIRPGITGYTQAYYRNNLGVRDKRLYDAWYAHNVSLLLDVKIFFKSIVTVLKRENVYTN